ncbi:MULTISPECIES: LysR substrate-binding domain-containing protein [unclassified Caballeronia]|uniref:LysR substrate-binding domain-containing protein n=1 Tax=unclassified Caballeronia TaxID=2646786 RepID=UPI001F37C5CE|nr:MULTISPECIES: LysR substrate-binding domain-containing protein [unclassified Caballeronia]MCE4545488.1 LysR substrate-binding domain-containing protein [Caballeronia sp. PC1]MCE4570914.1 LysR substrate-binding domain-containing protein [Caballeronia sp. CLC5]
MKLAMDGVKGYRRLIPSLTALVEFEAVARLRSFTHAAAELGVTQAAVSRQIRILEELLGVRLLDRLHRASTLTSEGEALYTVVAEAMGKIAGVFDRLSNGIEEEELVLATTAAFSHFRLMPSLAKLKRLQPNLRLRLTTTMFTADLRHNEVHAAVRWGNGKWSDGTSHLLFGEEVFPVCSPAWLDEYGAPGSLEELANLTLISYDPTSEGWLTWEEWFRAMGLRPAKLKYGLRTCLYNDAVQAARHGQGVALGWGRLLHEHLASGELVRLTSAALPLQDAYYVVVPHGRSITPTIQTLVELLRHAAGVTTHNVELCVRENKAH